MGGGLSKIEKHKEKGKLTAWERITYLLDDNQPYVEIGKFAADGMYAEHGGCPNAGVVVVLGYVSGRLCVVVSNDATVKAGAWFPMTGKKKSSCSRNRYGKPYSYYLLGRFRWRIPTHAR